MEVSFGIWAFSTDPILFVWFFAGGANHVAIFYGVITAKADFGGIWWTVVEEWGFTDVAVLYFAVLEYLVLMVDILLFAGLTNCKFRAFGTVVVTGVTLKRTKRTD